MSRNIPRTNPWLAAALMILAVFPAAPTAAQDGVVVRDGMVIEKWIRSGHVVLHVFDYSDGRMLNAFCPLLFSGDLLAETCNLFEVGDVIPRLESLAPDPASGSRYHRLTSVTIGHHGDDFAIKNGEVIGKRIVGSHVILELQGRSVRHSLEVLCPLDQPGDMLAEACNMIEVGDVAPRWDGLAPDPTSDFSTLHQLTSVTFASPR